MGDVASFFGGVVDTIGDVFEGVVDVVTAPLEFVADLVEPLPLVGPLISPLLQAPRDLFHGDVEEILRAVMVGVPVAFGAPEAEALTFFDAEEGVRFDEGALTSRDFVRGILELAGQFARMAGVLDVGVGARLDRLANTHGGLLQTILEGFFPELGKVTDLFGQVAGKQLPGFGRTTAQSARYGGVRLPTIKRMAELGMLPAEYTAEVLREGSPKVPEEDLGAGTGFEGYAGAGGGEVTAVAVGELGRKVAGLPGQILEGLLATLFDAGKNLLLLGGEVIPPVVDAMTFVGERTFGALSQRMVRGVKEQLEQVGPVRPGEQAPIYERMIGQAAVAGIGAHLTASALEFLMPLKHLGLPQIAALMADLAGFGLLTGSQLGPLVRAGIGRPAEYEANSIFRSQLPSPGEAKQFVLERIIDPDDYAKILRWHGYSEEWVGAFVREVWEEPSLREISTVMDDNPVDEEWLRKKVTETGLEDRDVDLFVEALQRRALRSDRRAYIGSLVAAYRDGLLSEPEVASELVGMRLPQQAADLILARAALERRNTLTDRWEQAYRIQVENRVMDLDDYRLALQGLGLEEERIQALVAIADATLRGRVARDEDARVKAAVREEQRVRVQLAQEAFRRGQLDARDLEAVLTGLGIFEDQARAMVGLEESRRAPVPRPPVVLTAAAQRQRENTIIQDAALAAFREGKTDEAALVRVLRSLGVPDREVEALVTLELARKDKPKPVVVKEDPAVVRARQLKTEAAIADFRAKRLSVELFRQRLLEAGHPPSVVDGFVERELARIPPPTGP